MEILRLRTEEYGTENFQGVPAKPEVGQLELLPETLEQIQIADLFVTSTEIATLNCVRGFIHLLEQHFCLQIIDGINRSSVLEPTMTFPSTSQLHRGSTMFTKLIFHGAFRDRNEAATVVW